MKLIVNVDDHWGIGRNKKLLFSIPEDMTFFKETTTGGVIVMGHSTLFTFPRCAPLKNRTNIVLSRNEDLVIEGALVCHSIEQLGDLLKRYDSDSVYVVGGSTVYEQLLVYCDTALVTKVHANGQADAFFPNLDANKNWVLTLQSDRKIHQELHFQFCRYTNSCVKDFVSFC